MRRSLVISLWTARDAAALAVAAVALPVLATSGASTQPAWIWPALIAVVVIGLGVLAVRIAAPQEGHVLDGRERGGAHDDRSSVFVVTREAMPTRRHGGPAALAAGSARPGPVAGGEEAPEPGAVLRLLAARLDDVRYDAGSPNVLSMTKRLGGEGGGAPGPNAFGVRCARSDEGEDTVLSIEGTLDTLTAPAVAAALEAVVEERRRSVTLELSGLQRLDGAGVSAIVRLAGRCRGFGGQVRVVGLGRQPRALFKLLRLDGLLQA